MSEDRLVDLKWKRPDLDQFPRVWRTFKAKDIDSDELVEYRIQDLPESRYEDALIHTRTFHSQEVPLSQSMGFAIEYYNDFARAWRSIFAQKTPIVCFREGSDEIVAMNMNYVLTKDDTFSEDFRQRSKSRAVQVFSKILQELYKNYNPFEFHGVDEYLSSLALCVDKKYRGRGIGQHLLEARKLICKEFNLKMTSTIFTSDYSNKSAERAGFVTDVEITFDEFKKLHPECGLGVVKSRAVAIKSLVIR